MNKIRIFISSPSDVLKERDALEHLIKNDLQNSLGKHNNLYIEPLRWETHGRPFMGDIQQNLFDHLGEYDIFIGIFWNRFGTPTGPYKSGSEAEFRDACNRWEKRDTKPIMMYFSKVPQLLETPEDFEQAMNVRTFEKELQQLGLVWSYDSPEAFVELVKGHLYDQIKAILHQRNGRVRNSADHKKAPTQGTAHPSAGARRQYLESLRRQCLRIPLNVLGDENVNTQGLKPVRLDEVFITLKAQKYGGFFIDEALYFIRDNTHAVLLGGPGSGKSSLVKHVLAGIAAAELGTASSPVEDAAGLLPVLIVLRELAPKLLRAQLKENEEEREQQLAAVVVELAMEKAGAYAEGVRTSFEAGNVFLVFDGLDEVPYHLTGLVREAVGSTLNHYDLKRIVTTCRVRSYTGEAIFPRVPAFELQTLTPDQIQAFIANWYRAQGRLGWVDEQEVEGLTNDLIEHAIQEPLLSLAENPMLLTTMTLIHQRKTRLPGERVKLYDLAVGLLLERWQEGRGGVKTELAAFIKSKGGKLRRVMERLGYEAHTSELAQKAGDLPREETIRLLSEEAYLGDRTLAEQFLDYVDQRAGLLIGQGGAVPTYGFPHRTVQSKTLIWIKAHLNPRS